MARRPYPKHRAGVSPLPNRRQLQEIHETEAELDKLCNTFSVDDLDDIEDIVSGRIGERTDYY